MSRYLVTSRGSWGTAEMNSDVIGRTRLTGDGWRSWEEGIYKMARG